MKTHFFYPAFSFILLLCSFTFLSCDKDNDTTGSSTYRVKEYIEYEDGIPEYKTTIDYEGNQVVAMHQYYKETSESDFVEDSRMLITYPDNSSAVIIWYDSDGQGGWEQNDKRTITFSGKFVTNCTDFSYNNGTWEPSYKFNREFDGSKLLTTLSYDYVNEGWEPYWKENLIYTGDLVSSSYSYNYSSGDWNEDYKMEINYNGSHFDNYIGYYYDSGVWTPEDKEQYTYEGDKISQIQDYNYYNGVWESTDYVSNFTYDSHGNVASWREQYSSGTWKLEFTYETGEGNWAQIIESEDDDEWLYFHMMPMPTKAKPMTSRSLKQMIHLLNIN